MNLSDLLDKDQQFSWSPQVGERAHQADPFILHFQHVSLKVPSGNQERSKDL